MSPAAASHPPSGRRVLHVVETLGRGAVETWLVRMLRHARSNGVDLPWTFYCALGGAGAMEAEARALGARVVHSPVPIGEKVRFARALRAEAGRGGYDVLHCHHDLVSAVYLLATAGLPIGRRIVHVHNADEAVLTPSRLKQVFYREPMRRVCLTLADRIVGISQHTLDSFLAGRRRRPGRDLVHYYGVDPEPFRTAPGDRPGFRDRLGFAPGARVLLFAGRMVPEKNPLFALEVLADMRKLDPAVVGVFVGAGSLDAPVRRRATELGLDAGFRHLGWRDDIPEIMACCDWFILPRPEHPMEGFGLAVVEAQLAGARLLLSRGIPDDPLLPTASFRRLALDAGPHAWAQAARQLGEGDAQSRTAALRALQDSPMAMDHALRELMAIHG